MKWPLRYNKSFVVVAARLKVCMTYVGITQRGRGTDIKNPLSHARPRKEVLLQVDFLPQRSRPPEKDSLREEEAGNERLHTSLAVNGDKCAALLNLARFCGLFVYQQLPIRITTLTEFLLLVLLHVSEPSSCSNIICLWTMFSHISLWKWPMRMTAFEFGPVLDENAAAVKQDVM